MCYLSCACSPKDIARGLVYMHVENIVHLDVKPDNLLSESGELWVHRAFVHAQPHVHSEQWKRDRRLGGVSPTGESFRFVRACIRVVSIGRVRPSSLSEVGGRPLPGNRFVSFVRAYARCPLPSGNEPKR